MAKISNSAIGTDRHKEETRAHFVAELRALAEFCNYDETLNNMHRDRIVCGVRDKHIQQRLLAEGNLTLQKALDIALSMEHAVKNAATRRGKDSDQAIAALGFSHGNNVHTNPSLDQIHTLKGKHSYKQQFAHNSKGQIEPLPPYFRCTKTG